MPNFLPVFRSPKLSIPAFPREVRAAWVATVSNIDWPSSKTLTVTQQKNEILNILTVASELKLNALWVQVRPQCDALYPSSLEPWSPYLTGTMGKAPNPLYDPLAFWIEEAHKRGIEIHAWFNPYRALVNKDSAVSSNHISVTHPEITKVYGSYKWLDPGEPLTQSHTRSVIMDVVNRYDVDGVVYDDYFYPYPISGTPFPDSGSYALYGGGLSLENWRRKNVDDFVLSTYNAIKAAKPWVRYGIGPFGIWKPGNPPGVTGLSAYDSLYADSRKWIQLGWVDYLSPQLYWTIDSSGQPYEALLVWWTQQNLLGRHILPSNFTSKLDGTSSGWPAQEIQDQIDVTRSVAGAVGNCHFSMRAFTQNRQNITTLLKQNQYSTVALPPAATWLDSVPPMSPNVNYSFSKATALHTISWSPVGSEEPRWYAAAVLIGDAWSFSVYPVTTTSFTVPLKNSGKALRAFGIASVDRCGNMSPWTTRVLDPSALTGGPIRDGEAYPSLPVARP